MSRNDWRRGAGPAAQEEMVVGQAAAVMAAVVRATVADAVRAANRCRCRRCRRQAAATLVWAVDFLYVERAAPVATRRLRWPWSWE